MLGRITFGVRAEAQRLEHRHRRSNPESAGDVAGRGDHAALAAADDHRLGGKRRIVAFLDRGVEGVAIDMGDGKAVEFGDGATDAASRKRRSAPACGAASARQSRQKLTAETHGKSRSHLRRRAHCGPRDLGRIDPGALRRKRSGDFRRQAYAPGRRRESQARAPRREFCSGANPGHGEKALEPFRLLGDEGKRLNRQHFRSFSRVS